LKLLEENSPQDIRFYAPEKGKTETNVESALGYLRIFVETVTAESYGRFEDEARR
jgi:hypothetical protein